MNRFKGAVLGAVPFLLFAVTTPAFADDREEIKLLRQRLEALETKLAEQDRKVDERTTTLATEIEKSRLGQLIPEKAELKSEWGLGPAASSVYNVSKGLSIGGYGEANYRSFVDDVNGKKDVADFLRLVTYLGYKFDENILFNSEVEFEHGTTGGIGDQSGESEGEVSVEFAYLDFLMNKAANIRTGMMLVPMGFINETHEPPYYFGVRRPETESVIIPSTWRELGFGLFGEIEAAGKVEYRTYLLNGLRASRFEDSGIRGGRQNGNRALTEDIAWTSRLDYSPDAVPGLLVGSSFWLGNSGQDEDFAGSDPNVRTIIGDAHAQYKYRQLELRALGAWGEVDDADVLSAAAGETIGERFYGWYVEAGYDILPHLSTGTRQYLAPFVRFEQFDTHADVPSGLTADESLNKDVYTIGFSYKPIEKVVIKADYRNFSTDGAAKTSDEVAVGVGFVF